MLFPDSDRVIYSKNPLAEVICQLRFPRILRIDSELPAQFQDLIRSEFPGFTEGPAAELGPLPPELARIVGLDRALPRGQQRYDFTSADGVWKVSLTSQFLALTTSKYERWEGFKEHLRGPIAALQRVYAPAFFSRIGLRYQDVIRRSTLGLVSDPWGTLLASHVLGELCEPGIEEAALHVARQLLLRLDDAGDSVRVQHGFARSQAPEDDETCYLIDGDFFLEARTEPQHVTTVLDRLNRESGKLFRWCITERLHDAMGPTAA